MLFFFFFFFAPTKSEKEKKKKKKEKKLIQIKSRLLIMFKCYLFTCAPVILSAALSERFFFLFFFFFLLSQGRFCVTLPHLMGLNKELPSSIITALRTLVLCEGLIHPRYDFFGSNLGTLCVFDVTHINKIEKQEIPSSHLTVFF